VSLFRRFTLLSAELESFASSAIYYSACLDFIAKIAGSIAWPIAIYLLARIFRSEVGRVLTALSERLAELRELRGFGARASFGGRVAGTSKFEVGPPPQ
jgi:hypothetical protein